jgi:hypothetical protein
MDVRLATLKAASFYLPHNVSTLNQCIKLSGGTVVCKHFASYQGYPNYRWNLIRYAKGYVLIFWDSVKQRITETTGTGSVDTWARPCLRKFRVILGRFSSKRNPIN